jgi:hypothetical protein
MSKPAEEWNRHSGLLAKPIHKNEVHLKIKMISLLILLLAAGTTTYSQEMASRYRKQHLEKTEKMLIQGLESRDATIQITTAQTIRDLESEFPDQEFSSLINPLVVLVKNESANLTARLLGLLALDCLHSETGDLAIAELMRYTENKSVKDLCTALREKSLR